MTNPTPDIKHRCGVANPSGSPCTRAKGHAGGHDLAAYGPSTEALEPSLEDLAIQAATFLESFAGLESDRVRGQQIAFALRARVSAPLVAPVVDEASLTEYVLGFCPEKGRGNAILSVEGELTLLGKQLVRGLAMCFAFATGKFPDPRHWQPVIEPVPASTVAPQQSEPTNDYAVTASTQCANCGGGIADYWTYCHRCGADREEVPASPAAPCGYCADPEHFTARIELPHREGVWHRSELGGYYRCTAPAATTPPSTLAKAAAEEINAYYNELVGFVIRVKGAEEVAAIIERCLAGGREEQ